MLKRNITYEDFNGETVTETFYFNLTKSEIVELELSYEGGLEATLRRIIAAEDINAILKEFKKIILLSYGKKSDDGKRFIKNDELRDEFSQTAAYDALFMELSTNENSAAEFVQGIVPSSLSRELENVNIPTQLMKPTAPPQPPSPTQ